MWVFMSNAFLSIVEDRDDPKYLIVRARAADDIDRVFPVARIFRDPMADYLYRARIPRETVARTMAAYVHGIDYDKLKPTVYDNRRASAYLGVWSVMAKYQDNLEPEAYQEWLKPRNEDPRK